jgi:hypothetical protein
MNYFPDNTVAQYTTKLPHPICIDGDYEVALTELIYPMDFHNFVPKDKYSLRYPPDTMPIWDTRLSSHNLVNWELKSGYFEHVNELVDYLNKDLLKAFKTLYSGEFIRHPRKTFFRIENECMRFNVPALLELESTPSVAEVYFNAADAGLSKNLIRQLKIGKKEAFKLSDPYSENRLMYVYSDIVSPNMVGDVQTPLLRVVALKGNRGDMISEVFHNPYYVPVARRGFDTIEININTELGEPMPFGSGKSVAVLHFRK